MMKQITISAPLISVALPLFFLFSCNTSNSSDKSNSPRTIVFAGKKPNEEFQIFSMRENGSSVKQLTHDNNHDAEQPAWSSDGLHIAFVRYHSTAAELWVMNADGSNQKPLIKKTQTGNPQNGLHPAWSPDGTKVAFESCCGFTGNSNILIADLQTGKINAVTNGPHKDANPTWSPDGKKIAFASDRDYIDADSARYRTDLYVINIDGTHRQRLTATGKARSPRWSPDGIYVAYANLSNNTEIFLLNLETKNVSKLTNLKAVGAPLWNMSATQLLIPGTTHTGEHVLQLISIEGKIEKNVDANFDDLKIATGYDWYGNKKL